MTNRRTFIKQIAAAGMITNIPAFSIQQKKSVLPIKLIVRADDLGQTWGVTTGIIKAHKEGIVTSASIMPTGPFFEESVRLCKDTPTLAVGVHITLMDVDHKTRSVLSPASVPSLLNPEGFFHETLDKMNKSNPKAEEIEKEIHAQIKKAKDSGLHFVYLDNHMAVPPAGKEIIDKICIEQKLIRQILQDGSLYGYKRLGHNVESWPRQILPDGQTVLYAAPSLKEEKKKEFYDLLLNLEPGGKFMINFHPGLGEPERISITELLCSAETKEIIKMKNIQLVSYADVWKEVYGKTKIR